MLLRHSVLGYSFRNINISKSIEKNFQDVQKWREVFYTIDRNIFTHTVSRTHTIFFRSYSQEKAPKNVIATATDKYQLYVYMEALSHMPYHFPRKVPFLKWPQTNAERLLRWVELQTALQFSGKKMPCLFPNHGRTHVVRFQIFLVNRSHSQQDWY